AADADNSISSFVGGAGLGLSGGMGAGINLNLLQTTTLASLENSSVDVADLRVTADSRRSLDAFAMGAAASTGLSLAGGINVNVAGSADLTAADDKQKETWEGTKDAREDAHKYIADSAGQAEVDIPDDAQTELAPAEDAVTARVVGGDVTADTVSVEAVDETDIGGKAGAGSLGLGVGVGAGVAVNAINTEVKSSFKPGTAVVDDSLNVTARASGKQTAGAYVGAVGGLVGIGAAVAINNLSSSVEAELGGNIKQAGAITVDATDDTDLSAEAYGEQVGALAVGGVVVVSNKSGTVSSGVVKTSDITAGQLELRALSSGGVSAWGQASAGGLYSGSGVVATARQASQVDANIGSGSKVDAGDDGRVSVKATADTDASAEALGVNIGGVASLGAAVADTKSTTTVNATVTDADIT